MDFEETVEKLFGKDAEVINYIVDSDVEEQKATHVTISVDLLIHFWDAAFEAGCVEGYENCEKDHPEIDLSWQELVHN